MSQQSNQNRGAICIQKAIFDTGYNTHVVHQKEFFSKLQGLKRNRQCSQLSVVVKRCKIVTTNDAVTVEHKNWFGIDPHLTVVAGTAALIQR